MYNKHGTNNTMNDDMYIKKTVQKITSNTHSINPVAPASLMYSRMNSIVWRAFNYAD